MDTETQVSPSAPELKRATYRLFKYQDDSNGLWAELEPLTGEGIYGYYPTAQEIGELHGPGDYMYFQPDSYGISFKTVVAETHYREQPVDEAA